MGRRYDRFLVAARSALRKSYLGGGGSFVSRSALLLAERSSRATCTKHSGETLNRSYLRPTVSDWQTNWLFGEISPNYVGIHYLLDKIGATKKYFWAFWNFWENFPKIFLKIFEKFLTFSKFLKISKFSKIFRKISKTFSQKFQKSHNFFLVAPNLSSK